MKKYYITLLGIILVWMNSCREEPIELCPEIYIPMATKLTYIDQQGNNLFTSKKKQFELKKLSVYQLVNDNIQPVNFTIAKDSTYITVHLEQSAQDTFFIDLKPGVVEKITVKAQIDESKLPCENYNVIAIQNQGNPATFVPQEQLWRLTYN
ncbi:MAG: hypothetical protein ACRDE7_04595 [Sphingobacterium sp.]